MKQSAESKRGLPKISEALARFSAARCIMKGSGLLNFGLQSAHPLQTAAVAMGGQYRQCLTRRASAGIVTLLWMKIP